MCGNATRNLRHSSLQKYAVATSSGNRPKCFHDFGGGHRVLHQEARPEDCGMQTGKFRL
jgi:hypothetical protein